MTPGSALALVLGAVLLAETGDHTPLHYALLVAALLAVHAAHTGLTYLADRHH